MGVFVNGGSVFQPITWDRGTNVARCVAVDELMLSLLACGEPARVRLPPLHPGPDIQKALTTLQGRQSFLMEAAGVICGWRSAPIFDRLVGQLL